MADDMYGANQQESNENADNAYYNPQEQPQPKHQTQPRMTQSYSPAPEFGAYGPLNPNSNENANSPTNQSGENAQSNPYFASPDSYDEQSDSNNIFGNPYELKENSNANNGGQPNMHSSDHTSDGANSPQNAQKSGTIPPIFISIISASVSAIVCVIVMAFAISQGLLALPQYDSLSRVGSNTSGPGTTSIKGGQAPDWKNVARNVSGSVVSIQTQLEKGMSKGSGVITDARGYIVTNNHVIAGAKQIQATLSNGQMYSAKVVGTDKTTDLAVLKIDNLPNNFKTAQFANSDLLAVGEPVMAIGNPLGYDDTATTGIVSALNRPVSVMDDQSRSEIVTNAVQIDAAINPGNSGGPTFNATGQIIGINSSIAATSAQSGTAGSIGIGFAIPANLVKRVVSEIIKNGSVKHVALGIMIKSVAVESNGITRGGAQVVSVNQGTPAARAGLKANDTIVAFDDKPVTNNYALLGYVRATAFKENATLTVVRGGNTLKLNVKFDQEEAKVAGMNRQENRTNKDQKQLNPRKRKSESDDDDDLQQRGGDDGDGDDGGIFDPFGFW